MFKIKILTTSKLFLTLSYRVPTVISTLLKQEGYFVISSRLQIEYPIRFVQFENTCKTVTFFMIRFLNHIITFWILHLCLLQSHGNVLFFFYFLIGHIKGNELVIDNSNLGFHLQRFNLVLQEEPFTQTLHHHVNFIETTLE